MKNLLNWRFFVKSLVSATIAVSAFCTLNAQDTIRYLIITEYRGDDSRENYVEISNVGDSTLNLSDFQIGDVDPWNAP